MVLWGKVLFLFCFSDRFSKPITHFPVGNQVFDLDSEQQEVMVTGLAEGEVVSELISQRAALVCRAISPSFLRVATMKSCSDWADKALRGKSVRFGSTNSPQVPQRCWRLVWVKLPYRSRVCVCQASGMEKYCLAHLFWLRYLYGVHIGVTSSPPGEQWCWIPRQLYRIPRKPLHLTFLHTLYTLLLIISLYRIDF